MARILAALALGLAIAGAFPFSASALTLGEIDLQSALNQPFNAEIPVSSESSGDIENLRVVIADNATFEQFGLDRPAFLSGFEFSVVSAGAASAVRVTSAQPVVEPFVTFLVEVSWPQGRLLREYTVLLDPPVFATEFVETAVAAPAAPAVSNSAPQSAAEVSRTPAATQPQAAPAAPSPAAETVPDSMSASTSTAAQSQPVPASEPSVYGPVQRNDTLWDIAGDMLGDSAQISRNQMMMAIYQANPEAFSGNINRLKAGMILRVPATADIALGKSEATAAVREQNAEWRSSTGRAEEAGGRLKLVPPPETDSDAADPAQQVSDGGAADSATSTDSDSAALQSRVQQLESDLDESRRQLEIRDQELEALQRQLAQISSAEPADTAGDEVAGDESMGLDQTTDAAADEDLAFLEDPDAADTDQAVDEAAADAEDRSAPADVTPAPVAQSDADSSAGGLLTNPLVYISLVVVLLLAWLVARNRSKSEGEEETGRWDALDEEQPDEAGEATTQLETQPPADATFVVEESTPSPAEATEQDGLSSPFADDSSEEWVGLEEETETPLERTISTDSAVNLDQTDPIAESDFHMAYGLYDQAADLLTKAIETEPERKDLRMKLLEVYFIWENKDGFLKTAQALQQQSGETSDPDWNKVLIMGKQICPDEALFADAEVTGGTTEEVDLEFGDDGGDDNLDLAFDDDSQSSVDLEFDSEAAGLDLDLTGEQDLEASALDLDIGSEDEVTQVAGDEDLDLSGESPTMETPTIESEALESTMETPTIESEALDSTMETPTIESPALDSTVESPTLESPTGDWQEESGEAASDQTAEIDLDDLDLDLSGLDELDTEALAGDEDELSLAGLDADADGSGDETREQQALNLDAEDEQSFAAAEEADAESTAEMMELDDDSDSGGTVEQPGLSSGSDTVEQPAVGGGDTAEQPGLNEGASDAEMIDVGQLVADEAPTEAVESSGGEDGATMTEVGTKLDLARAYIDMGDPDGARSILNEVLEEADSGQKQEAQKLLDDLVE